MAAGASGEGGNRFMPRLVGDDGHRLPVDRRVETASIVREVGGTLGDTGVTRRRRSR
jgi:hypothetical protein